LIFNKLIWSDKLFQGILSRYRYGCNWVSWNLARFATLFARWAALHCKTSGIWQSHHINRPRHAGHCAGAHNRQDCRPACIRSNAGYEHWSVEDRALWLNDSEFL